MLNKCLTSRFFYANIYTRKELYYMRPKTDGLTKKQKLVLDYIKKFQAENKYPPSVRQICSAIDLNSPATVHVHINHLVEKGFLKRSDSGNRAIEILVDNEYEDKKLEIKKLPLVDPNKDDDITLAIEESRELFTIPTSLIKEKGEYFAYLINDNSMNQKGIYQNDVAILKKNNKANNDDIILVEYNNIINLKEYCKDKEGLTLKGDIESITTKDNEINIIGKVVGLYRNYNQK